MHTHRSLTNVNPTITSITAHHGTVSVIIIVNLQAHWAEMSLAKQPKHIEMYTEYFSARNVLLKKLIWISGVRYIHVHVLCFLGICAFYRMC